MCVWEVRWVGVGWGKVREGGRASWCMKNEGRTGECEGRGGTWDEY